MNAIMLFTVSFSLLLPAIAASSSSSSSRNETGLSCYQCVRQTEDLCTPQDLRSCPKISDRCVTHIQKDENTGLTIKRECGLGPCQFDDEMAQRGLGLDRCDRSRKQYFCVFCCKESGCNGASSHLSSIPILQAYLWTAIIILSAGKIRHIL